MKLLKNKVKRKKIEKRKQKIKKQCKWDWNETKWEDGSEIVANKNFSYKLKSNG